MIKLNLGCGKDRREGFINIDILQQPCIADLVADVRYLPFQSNSVDHIMANDVFEHISFTESKDLLAHWYDIMKPGGMFYMKAPCLDRIIQYYQEEGHKTVNGIETTIRLLYGDQNYQYNYHYTITTPDLMNTYLLLIGFKEVEVRLNNTNAEYRAIKPQLSIDMHV